jgi:hypothetical protein
MSYYSLFEVTHTGLIFFNHFKLGTVTSPQFIAMLGKSRMPTYQSHECGQYFNFPFIVVTGDASWLETDSGNAVISLLQ